MTEIAKITTPWYRELHLFQDTGGAYYMKMVDSMFQKSITACLTEDAIVELRDALNTILDPQLYYLRLIEDDAASFINIFDADGSIHLDDKQEWGGHQTRFTAEEIEGNPALKKFEAFKVPVEEVDG